MKSLAPNAFTAFAKIKTELPRNPDVTVTYTRVSSKEQTDNNSLDIQKRECLKLAAVKNLTVLEQFGGTYESAQNDERKEFNRMIVFAKRHRVSTIIVYSLDRFSRSGDNAIWLLRQLRNLGIQVISVTQPIDTNNPSGVMMQNILLLFAQHDNDQRRTKTVSGMQERLRKGNWTGKAPVGYVNVTENGIKTYIPDKTIAPFIQQAFAMKVANVLTDVEIAARMNAAGWKQITSKKLSVIFKNPFYCGLMANSVLAGEVIAGKHKPLISQEIFLQVNRIKDKAHHGYKWDKESEALPLRSFVRCHVCGTGYAGYVVKKKGLHYYKCNRKGCKCNRSAKVMHSQFMEFVKPYMLDPRFAEPFKDYLIEAVHEQTKQNRELLTEYQKQLGEQQSKLDKITERFALEEITLEVFERYAPKYRREISRISTLIASLGNHLSNPEYFADHYIEKAGKLHEMWENGSHEDKMGVQKLVFPEGIRYDHKIGQYRTPRINGVFALILLFSGKTAKEETGLIVDDTTESGLVVPSGIEPER